MSVDQLVSPTPGLIAQLRGIPTKKRYTVATIFVDHYSGFGYVHLQKSTGAEETVEAKEAFELIAETHGVTVQHYHADNGVFADNKFRQAVREKSQGLSFCGVNAHWQNGRAEKRIRDLVEHARTILIHANRRWPSAISHHLWPYAIRHANTVHNYTPSLKRKDGKSPAQLFSNTNVNIHVKHWVPFGCPVYVLDSALQNQKSYNKWKQRARVGIYLGFSAQHARSVALVLNMRTGLTSPQFHVQFDTKFETMRRSFRTEDQPVSNWMAKCHFNLTQSKADTKKKRQDREWSEEPTSSVPEGVAQLPPPLDGPEFPDDVDNDDDTDDPDDPGDDPGPPPDDEPGPGPPPEPPPAPPAAPATTTRSGRLSRAPERLIEVMEAKMESIRPTYVSFEALTLADRVDKFQDADPLMAYKATSDPDTLYLHEALKQPDRAQFIKAMVDEIDGQQANGNWEIIPRRKVPQGVKVLPAVWSMKRKRRIATREVYRWRARLNVGGHKQQYGVDYWETYSPVVSWPVIRLILALAIIKRWHSKQIDYVQAFPQAKAEHDNIYMEVPKGFDLSEGASPKDFVLHVRQNIYGSCQAGRVWNLFLTEKLEKAGLQQSKVDQCVFTYKRSIYILYTDDSILVGPCEKELDEIISLMKGVGLRITEDGTIGDFLGVKIDRDESSGSVTLSQPALIESTLKDLRLNGDNVVTKDTPARVSATLRRAPEDPPFDGSFHYRSVIGKLNYLLTTRMDLAYACHQCARFSNMPKQVHGKAVRWIGRYLATSRDKGLTFTPDESESFQVYVDADFAGNWSKDTAEWDVDTARSRTGFIVTCTNCPMCWASKLQTEISNSTTEAEFVAASQSLREVIPMMELMLELQDRGFQFTTTAPKVHCKLFEDNSGAVELLRVKKMRSRTKHINIKYHFSRSYVEKKYITMHPVSSANQASDFLTKSLPMVDLVRHRLRMMGW